MIKQLKDIVTISSGYSPRGRLGDVPNGDCQVIQARDLDNFGKLSAEGISKINYIKKFSAHQVQDGDVVYMARGSNIRAITVRGLIGKAIVTNTFFILKSKPGIEVLPEYLTWFLNHPKTRARISEFLEGATIKYIKKQNLEDFEIRVPTVEVQQKIISLDGLTKREKQLHIEIAEKRELLVNAINYKRVTKEII